MIITATVMVTYPPNSSDTPIPIAVVMDFGRSVTYSSCERPKSFAKTNTVVKLVTVPANKPNSTAL